MPLLLLLLCEPHSETGLPLGDKMAAATPDFPSSCHTEQERHPVHKNLSQKSEMLLSQRSPVSPNTEHTCLFLSHFLWPDAVS